MNVIIAIARNEQADETYALQACRSTRQHDFEIEYGNMSQSNLIAVAPNNISGKMTTRRVGF